MKNIKTFFQWALLLLIVFFVYISSVEASGKTVGIYGSYAIVRVSNPNNSDYYYVNIYTNGMNKWQLQEQLYHSYVNSVSIANDYAIVGTRIGKVFIYKRNGSTWSQVQEISFDNRYVEVSIFEDYAIVAISPKAYILARNDETWTKQELETNILDSSFGINSVYISSDFAIVGAYNADGNAKNSGAAYIFKRSGTKWSHVQKIYSNDGKTGDYFGESVSISNNYAIVGYSQSNRCAYIFKRNGDQWLQAQKITGDIENNGFGYEVSISDSYAIVKSSSTMEIGGCTPTAIYIFKNINDSWIKFPKIVDSNNLCNGKFGSSIDIYNDTIIVSDSFIKKISSQPENCITSGYLLDQINNPLANIEVQSFLFGHTVTDDTGYYSYNNSCLFLEDTCLYDKLIFTNGSLMLTSTAYGYCVSNTYNIDNLSVNAFIISGYIKNPEGQAIKGV
ncbi:MAG: hypothetical protein OMM_12122, partial [Candidatus Magnetoglobus multicellularis str. Araruama]